MLHQCQSRSLPVNRPIRVLQRVPWCVTATASMSSEQKQVKFPNKRGQQLAGTLTLSIAPEAHKHCLILCHGYTSYKDGFQLPSLASALAAAGFNSLRFDFAGNGDSEGSFKLAGYHEEADDVAAAKAFLEQQEGQTVVGLLGHSKGGDVVVLYASKYGDIPRVINVAGRFDLSEGIDMRFGADIYERVKQAPVTLPAQRDDSFTWSWQLTQEDLQDRLDTDMPAAAAAIKPSVQVLTIHGTADNTIPVTDGRKFAAAIPNSVLAEVEGADHNFRTSPEHVQQLCKEVVEFLQAPSVQ